MLQQSKQPDSLSPTTTTNTLLTTTDAAPVQDEHNEQAAALSRELVTSVQHNFKGSIAGGLKVIRAQGHWDYFSKYFAHVVYEPILGTNKYPGLETFLCHLTPEELASTIICSKELLLGAVLKEKPYEKTKQTHNHAHSILQRCTDKKAVESVIKSLTDPLSKENASNILDNRRNLRIVSHYTDLECVQKLSIYPQIQEYRSTCLELATQFKIEEKKLYKFEEHTIMFAGTPFNTACYDAFSNLYSSGNSSSASNNVVAFISISKNMLASLKAQMPTESREKVS